MSAQNRLAILGAHLSPNATASTMAAPKSPITTHILDTALGKPAANVSLCLEALSSNGEWSKISDGRTNEDGRCPTIMAGRQLERGLYRMTFQTGEYFAAHNTRGFYPYVQIVFDIQEPTQHYHIPLLLSPYGYSTYRGS